MNVLVRKLVGWTRGVGRACSRDLVRLPSTGTEAVLGGLKANIPPHILAQTSMTNVKYVMRDMASFYSAAMR